MKWINVESVEELKDLGKFLDVKKQIKEDIGSNTKLTGRSWDDVYNNIVNFRNLINSINEFNASQKPIQIQTENKEEYFTSKANEYIFYLTELDGESRMKKLGITKSYFSNKKKAKSFRDKISKEIHPDKNNHPKSEKAMAILNELYASMIGKE